MTKSCGLVGLCAALFACSSSTSSDLTLVGGKVVGIRAGADASQIRLRTAQLGDIFFFARSGISISVVRAGGRSQPASPSSFAVGDSVNAWYDSNGIILDSNPAVYPVKKAEIVY